MCRTRLMTGECWYPSLAPHRLVKLTPRVIEEQFWDLELMQRSVLKPGERSRGAHETQHPECLCKLGQCLQLYCWFWCLLGCFM